MYDHVIRTVDISAIHKELAQEGCDICGGIMFRFGSVDAVAADVAQTLDDISGMTQFDCWHDRADGLARYVYAQLIPLIALPPQCGDDVRDRMAERAFLPVRESRS